MKIKSLPKQIYVGIEHDGDEDYLNAHPGPANLINVGDRPRQVGVYELKEIKTIEALVSIK